MPDIKFTATDGMLSYHDNPTWQDGDVRHVEVVRATDMVKSFPKNFAFVTESKAVEKATNKAVTKGKNKGFK